MTYSHEKMVELAVRLHEHVDRELFCPSTGMPEDAPFEARTLSLVIHYVLIIMAAGPLVVAALTIALKRAALAVGLTESTCQKEKSGSYNQGGSGSNGTGTWEN